MVQLVLLLEATQDRDRIFNRRLCDKDRLEPPRQSGVLFDMLAVFVECRRTDTVQLTAREGGFQHIGGVHRTLGCTGPDQRVQFVDEQDDFAFLGFQFLQNSLQALLEFATELGASHERAEVQRKQSLVLEPFRHIAVDDALRKSLDDRRFPDPGLTDQHRVILGAPRQHLHGAPDFLVASDHWIDLALTSCRGEVAGVFLQSLVLIFRRGAVCRTPLAQVVDRLVQVLRRNSSIRQRLRSTRALLQRERKQHAFRSDETVSRLVREFLCLLEETDQFTRRIDLPRAGAFDFR